MLTEALFDTLKDDLVSGRNPLHRQRAPKADWDELFDVLRCGQRLEGSETGKAADGKVVQQFRLRVTTEDQDEKPVQEPEPLSPLWIQEPESHVSP